MSSVIRIRIFVLLSFIFSAGLIWYAWSRMQTNVDGLVQTVQESTMPDRNLVRIKELWIGFSTSGTGVKAFSVSRDDQLLEKFLQVKDSLNAVVDTLRKDAQQRGDDIDIYNEISLLLNEKETIYKDLIEINYNQVLTEAIEKMGDAEFTIDTLIANPDQGNFFQRMFSSRYSRKTLQARADSILVNRNRRIEEYQKNMKLIREEEARLLTEQSEKERILLNNDQDVTSRIGSLILELENSERNRLVNHAQQEEFKAEKAGRGIRNIVYGGLVLFALLFLIIVVEVELANKRRKELAVAKDKAEKLAAAKEEFMATMSHEIRTPLTSIIGFSSKLLESGHQHEQSNRYLKAIQGSSSHLLAVVNDVLDYSRIESGKLRFSGESFRVDEVFKEVFDALLWKAEEKGIEFSLFIQPLTGLILRGDPIRIKQVLYNLAGNAIKFTEKGNVSLSATVINEAVNTILTFKVSDTGIGIPPDKLELVFNEFEQGGSSIEKNYGGTGLGLAISKRIVDQMGGHIEVNSQPGLGSVFKVSMPLQFETQSGSEISYTEDPGLKPLCGKFILLVEDDPLICELVNHTLENFGAKVVTSNNGNDAIQVFGNSNIDLVLVDIQLPGRTGTEIITTIRNEFQGAKSKIPVIAMTANVMLHDINHWLKEGMSDFITKPFRDAELITKISKLLEIPITESVQTITPVFDPVPVLIEPQKQKDKLYDLKELIETSNGNSEFTRKMINLFLTSSFASLNNLRFHLRQKNWDQLGKTAHRMLGSYKQLGIYHVVVLLKELETLCSGEQELGRAAWLVNEIDKHSLEVSGLLKSELYNYS